MIIKKQIRKAIKQLLNKYDIEIFKSSSIKKLLEFYPNVIEKHINNSNDNKVDIVVFSKDRAMQLFAFIESFNKKVINKGRLYVLYTTSTLEHKHAYKQLIESFKQYNIDFIQESDFREQLIDICDKVQAKKIGFFVDDMIFIKDVDFFDISQVDSFKYIVALSRGKDLDYSVVLGKELVLPSFYDQIGPFECFKWNESDDINDWNYPLGVSGYFYNRSEIIEIFKNIEFKASNSLEGQMQFYLPLFKHRFGLCYSQISCVCVHANIVQTEFLNKTIGSFGIEELLKLWQQGYKIDVEKFYDRLGRDAQFQPYEFVCKC